MSDKGVCRTAPVTPGLLKIRTKYDINLLTLRFTLKVIQCGHADFFQFLCTRLVSTVFADDPEKKWQTGELYTCTTPSNGSI